MKKVHWTLETGLVGCELEGIVEVEDSAKDEEIEKQVKEVAYSNTVYYWEFLDDGEGDYVDE